MLLLRLPQFEHANWTCVLIRIVLHDAEKARILLISLCSRNKVTPSVQTPRDVFCAYAHRCTYISALYIYTHTNRKKICAHSSKDKRNSVENQPKTCQTLALYNAFTYSLIRSPVPCIQTLSSSRSCGPEFVAETRRKHFKTFSQMKIVANLLRWILVMVFSLLPL